MRGDKNKCYYCGQPGECTKDHFIPQSKTGFLLVWACRVCQSSKADMMPLEWVVYLKDHILIDKKALERVETSVITLWEKIKKKEIKACRPEVIEARINNRKAFKHDTADLYDILRVLP